MKERKRYYSNGQFLWVTTSFGLFTGLIVFVLYFLLSLLFKHEVSVFYTLTYLLPLVGMILAVRRLRDFFGQGTIRFGQAFWCAWITGIIAAVVFALALYFVYSEMNLGELKHKALAIEQNIMAKSHTLSLSEIKSLRQYIQTILSPSYLASMNFIVYSIFGFFYALIIAIFARQKDRILVA
jgi:hypothetical protein